ncbi:TRAP transporter small permease [Paracoccus sp. (in: a-proteobacteria)]|uniref:TRAP transporter small permease n=1 Tax=Paracoccus sp. TaxID=267 RepID=UPI003A8425ED
MDKVIRALTRVIGAAAALGVVAYGAAAVATVADVLGRVVGIPVSGVVEMVQLGVMAGTWLVIPFAFLSGAHVGVDFVFNAMPRPVQVVLAVIIAMGSVVLVWLMLRYGFDTFRMRTMFGDKSQQLGIPIAVFWYPLLAGLCLSLVAILLNVTIFLKRPAHV